MTLHRVLWADLYQTLGLEYSVLSPGFISNLFSPFARMCMLLWHQKTYHLIIFGLAMLHRFHFGLIQGMRKKTSTKNNSNKQQFRNNYTIYRAQPKCIYSHVLRIFQKMSDFAVFFLGYMLRLLLFYYSFYFFRKVFFKYCSLYFEIFLMSR